MAEKSKAKTGKKTQAKPVVTTAAPTAEEIAVANFLAIETMYDLVKKTLEVEWDDASPASRKTMLSQLLGAHDTYWAAVASNLADTHELVVTTQKQLIAANAAVAEALDELTSIVQVLKLTAEAIKLAGSLVTIAAV